MLLSPKPFQGPEGKALLKAARIVSLVLIAGLGSAFAGSGPRAKDMNREYNDAGKRASRAEKDFKQHLKEERAQCKHHRHTVACNDLKERQRIEKRQFKAGEKTVQGAEASRRG